VGKGDLHRKKKTDWVGRSKEKGFSFRDGTDMFQDGELWGEKGYKKEVVR